jgi:hypothetical protein
MKKIEEMNVNELTACLCEIAEPAEKLFCDMAVLDALDKMKKSIPDEATPKLVFSLFMTIVYPRLMNEQNKDSTMKILAAMNGVTVAEIENRNGVNNAGEMFSIFIMDRDVESIFRPACEVRG